MEVAPPHCRFRTVGGRVGIQTPETPLTRLILRAGFTCFQKPGGDPGHTSAARFSHLCDEDGPACMLSDRCCESSIPTVAAFPPSADTTIILIVAAMERTHAPNIFSGQVHLYVLLDTRTFFPLALSLQWRCLSPSLVRLQPANVIQQDWIYYYD